MNGNPNSPQPGQPGGVQTMPSNGGANQMPPTTRPMPGLPGTPQTMGVQPGGGMMGTPGAGAYNPGGAGPGRQGPTWNPQLSAIYDHFNATGHGPGYVDPAASAGGVPGAGPGRILPGQGGGLGGMGGDVGGPPGGQFSGMQPQIQALLQQNPQLMQAYQRMRMQSGNPGMPGIMPSNPGANSGVAPGGGLLGLLGGQYGGMKPPGMGGQIQNPISNS